MSRIVGRGLRERTRMGADSAKLGRFTRKLPSIHPRSYSLIGVIPVSQTGLAR